MKSSPERKLCIPGVEEEAAEGGEEEARLEARVNEIDGFQILLDVGRDRVVDRSESGDSGEILAPVNVGVNVQHREFLLHKLRENPLL